LKLVHWLTGLGFVNFLFVGENQFETGLEPKLVRPLFSANWNWFGQPFKPRPGAVSLDGSGLKMAVFMLRCGGCGQIFAG
jgi:hypothetical protein